MCSANVCYRGQNRWSGILDPVASIIINKVYESDTPLRKWCIHHQRTNLMFLIKKGGSWLHVRQAIADWGGVEMSRLRNYITNRHFPSNLSKVKLNSYWRALLPRFWILNKPAFLGMGVAGHSSCIARVAAQWKVWWKVTVTLSLLSSVLRKKLLQERSLLQDKAKTWVHSLPRYFCLQDQVS